jgi:tetratricopeptide (TPR) repeat protein
MAREYTSQIAFVQSGSLLVRLGLIAAVIISILVAWYAFSREIGNMMAEVTTPTELNAKATAFAAIWLAPDDPMANWLAASTDNDSFTREKAAASVRNFENLIRLAPNDYRWWIELGRVREQTDAIDKSELAFKQAVALAPAYAYPRWQLGNFYLRQGRSDEAFAELKLAAANNAQYRDQVFYTVWEFFNQDKQQLERIVGDSPAVRATLAKFYANKGEPEAAVASWETLTTEQKEENKALGLVMQQQLFERKNYRASVRLVKDLGREPLAEPEQVQNPGFESPLTDPKETFFGWTVIDTPKANARLDANQKHEGKRSLRLNFNAFTDTSLNNTSQIIAVEPGARYSLTFWVKTENLKSAGLPLLQVAAINDVITFGASAPFGPGTNDWQQVKIDFNAPANVDGVVVRTVRNYCGENCPLVGTIWYDDFNLQKLSGGK